MIVEVIFIILVYLTGINCVKPEKFPHYFILDDENLTHLSLTVFICLLLIAFTRCIAKKLKILLPERVLMFLLGIAVGVAIRYNVLHVNVQADLLANNPKLWILIYIATVYFKKFIFLKGQALLKSFWQALILTCVGTLIDAIFVWILLIIVHQNDMTVKTQIRSVVFITLSLCRNPGPLLKVLNDIGFHRRSACGLLEFESLLTLTRSLIVTWYVHTINDSIPNKPWYSLGYLILILLVGCFLGFIFGKIFCCLLALVIKDEISVVTVIVAVPMVIVYLNVIIKSSILSASILTVMGIVINIQKKGYSPELDDVLEMFWNLLDNCVNLLLSFIMGMALTNFYRIGNNTEDLIELKMYLKMTLVYVFLSISRFLALLLVWPFIHLVGSGFSWKDLIVVAWCNVAGAFQLMALLHTFCSGYLDFCCDEMYIILSMYFAFTNLINGTTIQCVVRALRDRKETEFNASNMENCMSHILEVASYKMEVIKRRQSAGPINWIEIRKILLFSNPYERKSKSSTVEEKDERVDFELAIKYARIRILKTVRISYLKQYEQGILQPKALKALIEAVDDALYISKSKIYKVEYISRLFDKEPVLKRVWLCVLNWRTREDTLRKPKHFWGALIFQIRSSYVFAFLMEAIVVMDITTILLYRNHHTASYIYNFFIAIHFISIMEIVFNFLAASKYGCLWSVLFCLRGITVLHIIVLLLQTMLWSVYVKWAVKYYHRFLFYFIIVYVPLRFLRILVYIAQLIYALTPGAKECVQYHINKDLLLLYSLGKAYINGHDELLNSLDNLVSDPKIEVTIRTRLMRDKQEIVRRLGHLTQEHPWAAVTVKTKDVVRMVLNNTKRDIDVMKTTGRIDETEYHKLIGSCEEQVKSIQNYQKPIRPPSAQYLFTMIPWMDAIEPEIRDFLLKHIEIRYLDPEEVLYEEGEKAVGIFVVSTGTIKVTYNPPEEVVENLLNYGELPTVEATPSVNLDVPSEHFIVNGNSFGEMGVVTRKGYDCRMVAETQCQCYVIPREYFFNIFETHRGPNRNLESAMWKHATLILAIQLLVENRGYNSNREEVLKLVDRAFMPNLKDYKLFVVHMAIEDIVLIQGLAMDFYTKDVYVGPCYLPRHVEKIALPKSKLLPIPAKVDTKMLIVPVKDVSERELMTLGEEISDLWSRTSGRSLYHSIAILMDKERKSSYSQKRVTIVANALPNEEEIETDSIDSVLMKTRSATKRKKESYRDMRITGNFQNVKTIDVASSGSNIKIV